MRTTRPRRRSRLRLRSRHTAPWTGEHVARYSNERGLRSHHQRLRDRGLLSLDEIARQFPAHTQSIKRWHQLGLITGEQADDRGVFLYHPGQTRPNLTQVRQAGQQTGDSRRSGRRNPLRVSGRPRTPKNVTTACQDHISQPAQQVTPAEYCATPPRGSAGGVSVTARNHPGNHAHPPRQHHARRWNATHHYPPQHRAQGPECLRCGHPIRPGAFPVPELGPSQSWD